MQAYKIDVRNLTEQQKKDVQNAFFKLGYGWEYRGNKILPPDDGHKFYFTNPTGYTTYTDFVDRYCKRDFQQITYTELMDIANKGEDNMSNNFTKANLKDGMVVVYRDGNERLVYNNKLLTLDGFGGSNLTFFREDLTTSSGASMDITEVLYMGESIWKRPEQTEQQKQLSELKAAQEQLMLQAKDIADKIEALQRS